MEDEGKIFQSNKFIMKYIPQYKKKLQCDSADDVFAYLVKNLKEKITQWDYFVNWKKVHSGLRNVEINLNLMNYLIGKENIEQEAIFLLTEYPQIIDTIPVLLACRDNKFSILKEYQNGNFIHEEYNFSEPSADGVEKAVEFMTKSGFLEQLKSKRISSLVDYVFGVEVGLDSNARKNRGGTFMEQIVEFFVKNICIKHGFAYISQANARKVKKLWDKTITVKKSSRRIDFAINKPDKLYLIETNFYGGGGSKLKSTAGEYKSDFRRWSNDGHQFIWITDGAGWRSTHLPLRETFDEIDYILNLDMLEKGILENILADIM